MDTERLHLRPTEERDRDAFEALFCDEDFMVFAGGVLNPQQATERFDVMLQRSMDIPFAKQPVFEKGSKTILGYVGVNTFEFEGKERYEFGWRLIPQARGKGYATEAAAAVLELAAQSFTGEILCMIDPRNEPSKRVAHKLGFTFWKEAVVGGFLDELYLSLIHI